MPISRLVRAGLVFLIAIPLGTRADTQRRGAEPAVAATLAAFDVVEKSIAELQDAMAAGTVTSRQLVDIYLARIAAYDKQGPALNAIAARQSRRASRGGRARR